MKTATEQELQQKIDKSIRRWEIADRAVLSGALCLLLALMAGILFLNKTEKEAHILWLYSHSYQIESTSQP